jgi:1,4-dihydroxy-2-naphthoate octaprenyltransferase
VFAAAALIVIGAATGITPVPTLIALAGFPLALKVRKGLRAHYESPYELMAYMGTNIQLHMAVGMLLVLGYCISIAAVHLMHSPPGWLT